MFIFIHMNMKAETIQDYLDQLPAERRLVIEELRKIVKDNLPQGFEESFCYGMIAYVVPHNIYPSGYHCDNKQPLPFINIASQKNYIALYHMGVYVNTDLLNWFTTEYPIYSSTKLDMGKSCIRFKNIQQIPYQLIAQLCTKITVEDWINQYELKIKK